MYALHLASGLQAKMMLSQRLHKAHAVRHETKAAWPSQCSQLLTCGGHIRRLTCAPCRCHMPAQARLGPSGHSHQQLQRHKGRGLHGFCWQGFGTDVGCNWGQEHGMQPLACNASHRPPPSGTVMNILWQYRIERERRCLWQQHAGQALGSPFAPPLTRDRIQEGDVRHFKRRPVPKCGDGYVAQAVHME